MSFEIFTEEDRQQERELLASYDLDVRLFQKLGFNIKQIVPERNCFRIEADKGFFCLKKMGLSFEDIHVMQQITKHLRDKGYSNIFEIAVQDSNEILVPYGGSQYYLTKWRDGREGDYLNVIDIKAAAEALGLFHKATEGFAAGSDQQHRMLYGRWKHGFANKLAEIETAEALVGSEGKDKENTPLILQYLKSCKNSAKHALRLLDKPSYEMLNARDMSKQGFIHHDYGFHNILYTFENEIYIGGLESYAFDIRIHDLGYFIYRLMRRRGWDIETAFDIISSYNEIYRLEKEDYQVLAAYFAFPHDYKQFYRQYYADEGEIEDLEELEKINVESEYNQLKNSFLKEFENYAEIHSY